MTSKGYQYACQCLAGEKPVGRYIKAQCKIYKSIVDGEVEGAHFDEKRYLRLCKLLKIMINPKGINAGQSFFDSLYGFQWLLLESITSVVDDEGIRLYQNMVLEIARKNGKSQVSGLLMVIALLTEPKFSNLYSISVNAQLSRETYTAMKEILMSSPALFNEDLTSNYKGFGGHFQITANNIRCLPTKNTYTPLGNNKRALDGRLMSYCIIDETGALADNGPIEAARSSQITLKERLTIVLSTKYSGVNNPMEDEVDYCKKVLDGVIDDPRTFALLYEPDEEIQKEWATNDLVLQQANPLAVELPSIWQSLIDKRAKAAEIESAKPNFLLKHCNIMANDLGLEAFVSIDSLKKCRVDSGTLSWAGKDVYVGVDLSTSMDNTSVVMVGRDGDDIIIKPFVFVPKGRMEEKTRLERVDYQRYANAGLATPCGDQTIDYSAVESRVMTLEEDFGVNVVGVYMDPWNSQSSAQKFEEAGLPVVLVKQHSYILHEPTSYLEKAIVDGNFKYETNPLLEINFENCRCMQDTNAHRYVNKKKSFGKIDMVAALINGVYGLFQDSLTDSSFGAFTL